MKENLNKETKLILTFIKNNQDFVYTINRLRETYSNQRDFTNQLLYAIMDVLNREKQFTHIDRKNIDIIAISNTLF